MLGIFPNHTTNANNVLLRKTKTKKQSKRSD